MVLLALWTVGPLNCGGHSEIISGLLEDIGWRALNITTLVARSTLLSCKRCHVVTVNVLDRLGLLSVDLEDIFVFFTVDNGVLNDLKSQKNHSKYQNS